MIGDHAAYLTDQLVLGLNVNLICFIIFQLLCGQKQKIMRPGAPPIEAKGKQATQEVRKPTEIYYLCGRCVTPMGEDETT